MSHTNFLGIPVDGDIQSADKKTPQRPLSDLEPLLRAVLDDAEIVEFGWRQYTPYFNDGDPCVFRVNDLWFRTVDDHRGDNDEEEEYDDDFDLYSHPSLGSRTHRYNHSTGEYETGEYEGTREASYDRCQALNRAIQSGAFDDVLLEAFGDHARIRVKRDGISVEFYDHD